MRQHLWTGTLLISLTFLVAAPCYAAPSPAASPAPGELTVLWTATQPETTVKVFSSEDLKSLKKTGSTEVDPASGKKSHFEGVLLADVLEKALHGATNDRKALIDLVVLKNAQGAEALIPRSFIVKYPVVLALSENHKALTGPKSVVPWTSRSKTRLEGLPLETYFVDDVSQVLLANYHVRYGTVYLKERRDPVAMRGEKIFVQSCLSCHDSAPGISKARNWAGNHPAVNGTPKLDSRDQRALHSYLDSFKAESTAPATAAR